MQEYYAHAQYANAHRSYLECAEDIDTATTWRDTVFRYQLTPIFNKLWLNKTILGSKNYDTIVLPTNPNPVNA